MVGALPLGRRAVLLIATSKLSVQLRCTGQKQKKPDDEVKCGFYYMLQEMECGTNLQSKGPQLDRTTQLGGR
jgi:hypothetical protein